MITFQEETYEVMWTPKFIELTRNHWKEIGAFNKHKIKLAIDWDLYKVLGKNGNLIIFTVRDDGVLIGYNLFIIVSHPHYKNNNVAENDSLYLVPKYRKGFTGYKFIKYSVNVLKNKVDIITLSMKANVSFRPIVERLGFKLQDYKFTLEV